jgi:hypothetical protein
LLFSSSSILLPVPSAFVAACRRKVHFLILPDGA